MAQHPFRIEAEIYGEAAGEGMMRHALLEALDDPEEADAAVAAIKAVALLLDIVKGR